MVAHKLPASLWDDGSIRLPQFLRDALSDELTLRGLFQRACANTTEKEVFGGCDEEDTKKHFADRFKTSAARVAYVLSSPLGQFLPVSHDLLAALFDGSVAVLDIPCGSGGGLHGMLSTVCELRAKNKLPRTPIRVKVLAGDISQSAMEIHAAMMQRLKLPYSKHGIHVDWEHMSWDVQDPFSTAKLMDRWIETSVGSEEFLVLVSAFSGFADKHLEQVSQSLRDIVVRLGAKLLYVIWIEPDINEAKRLLPKLANRFLVWFAEVTGLKTNHYVDPVTFSYWHPFIDQKMTGRARVISFQRLSV